MMPEDELRLDRFLKGVEKSTRSARLISITLTIIPVLIGVLFLFITLKQVKQAQTELSETDRKLQQKRLEVDEKDREIAEREKSLDVLNKTVQEVPQRTFQEAINKTQRNLSFVEAVPAANEYIHKIDLTPISPKELKVNVHHSYDGKEGVGTVIMIASALQANGLQVPGTSYGAAVVKPVANPDQGMVTVSIEKTQNDEAYTSSRIRVCLQVAGGKTIACKGMDYRMEWK
jgi:uncharacterized membrane-anchored protein YhcB (DUF1043 family)